MSLESPYKSCQHSTDLSSVQEKSLFVFRRDVIHATSDKQMCFELHQRAIRNRKRVQIVAQVLPAMALRDVRCNGYDSAPQLRSEPVHFVLGKRSCQLITLFHEIHRLLPDFEFAIPPQHQAALRDDVTVSVVTDAEDESNNRQTVRLHAPGTRHLTPDTFTPCLHLAS